jgi:hypothetical protein
MEMQHTPPHKKKLKTVKSVGRILFMMHFSLWIPRPQSKSECRSPLNNTVTHEESYFEKKSWLSHSLSSFDENVMPILHTAGILQLATSVSLDDWGSTLKDNISDVVMRWKLSCASGCKHWPLISSPWKPNSLCITGTNVSMCLAIMWTNIEFLCYSFCFGHPSWHK